MPLLQINLAQFGGSVVFGILLGMVVIYLPSSKPNDASKKNDDLSNENEDEVDAELEHGEGNEKNILHLNEDVVVKKVSRFQQALGIPEDDIRSAVKDVNAARISTTGGPKGAEYEEPINWVKIVEYVVLFGGVVMFLWWMNIHSHGEVVHWLCIYFPKEMRTLGFVSKYAPVAENLVEVVM